MRLIEAYLGINCKIDYFQFSAQLSIHWNVIATKLGIKQYSNSTKCTSTGQYGKILNNKCSTKIPVTMGLFELQCF